MEPARIPEAARAMPPEAPARKIPRWSEVLIEIRRRRSGATAHNFVRCVGVLKGGHEVLENLILRGLVDRIEDSVRLQLIATIKR